MEEEEGGRGLSLVTSIHADLPETGAMTGELGGENGIQSLGLSVLGSSPVARGLIHPRATQWCIPGIAS